VSLCVAVPGASGRMGRLVVTACLEDPAVGLLVASSTGVLCDQDVGSAVGKQPRGVTIAKDLAQALARHAPTTTAGVLIDFTTPALLDKHLDIARARGFGVVVGTTGLQDDDRKAIAQAATTIPVLVAANTSLGANLLFALAHTAARALPNADAEIVEVHHRHKRDAPSGTALALEHAIADARALDANAVLCTNRTGHAPRNPNEIGVFGVRGGSVAGEHTAYFFLDGEQIELSHKVSDRGIFARGALVAAHWLVHKSPGLYSMAEVLGI
jgi:4-hydroxy-tetrahydrodipicolinate reductase